MLQYYLRAEGLALSWVGTSRLLFSLHCSDSDFTSVADRFLAATRAMQRDGWWWTDPATSNTSVKRQTLREMLGNYWTRINKPIASYLMPAGSEGSLKWASASISSPRKVAGRGSWNGSVTILVAQQDLSGRP
jgi:hypothetical protein